MLSKRFSKGILGKDAADWIMPAKRAPKEKHVSKMHIVIQPRYLGLETITVGIPGRFNAALSSE